MLLKSYQKITLKSRGFTSLPKGTKLYPPKTIAIIKEAVILVTNRYLNNFYKFGVVILLPCLIK